MKIDMDEIYEDLHSENQAHARVNRSFGFASLEGSPKQIEWAESIRRKRAEDISCIDMRFTESERKRLWNITKMIESSTWWINHKATPTMELAQEILDLDLWTDMSNI